MKYRSQHDYHLHTLANNLEIMNIYKRDIKWIMKDGLWFHDASALNVSLCDLLVAMQDNTVIPIELKGSVYKRDKAIDQLFYGRKFVEDNLTDYKIKSYGYFVIYHKGTYDFERISLK